MDLVQFEEVKIKNICGTLYRALCLKTFLLGKFVAPLVVASLVQEQKITKNRQLQCFYIVQWLA
jgi:hypothetical protein